MDNQKQFDDFLKSVFANFNSIVSEATKGDSARISKVVSDEDFQLLIGCSAKVTLALLRHYNEWQTQQPT